MTESLDRDAWRAALGRMAGASFFQTWAYAEAHSGGRLRTVRRFALRERGGVTALAQVRVKRIPMVRGGVGEVDGGPVWAAGDAATARRRVAALMGAVRTRLCDAEGLALRVRPRSAMDASLDDAVAAGLGDAGFERNGDAWAYTTIVLDLSEGSEAVRAGFRPKWRRDLVKSERAGLEVVCSTDPMLFARFRALYEPMWRSKRFDTGVRVGLIDRANRELPEDQRALICVASARGVDVGATVCLMVGDTMHYYLGASSLERRGGLSPGYLLQWVNIREACARGFRWYDTGGLVGHGDRNVNRFKERMGGARVVFPGQFESDAALAARSAYARFEGCFRSARRVGKRAKAVIGR